MKQCIKCNETKSVENFYSHSTTKDGLYSYCKDCSRKRRKNIYKNNKEKELKRTKEYWENNKEFYKEYTKKYYDTILKEKNEIERREKWFNKYLKNKIEIDKHFENKEITIDNCEEYVKKYNKYKSVLKSREYTKKWKENKNYQKKYYEENKQKLKEINKNYIKNRIKTDYIFKFKCNVRILIKGSFKRGKNQFRKDAKTEEILGCTIEEFRTYIESKFTKGMTFENYGKWHLDHIIPLAIAKTKEEILKLNHYTNFQPLWAEDNLKKGSKVLNTQLKLI